MTAKGFMFLMVVTVLAVMLGGWISEKYTTPGLERTIWLAVIAGAIVFPAARWAESRGWIKGKVEVGNLGSELFRKRDDGSSGSTPPEKK
jgi:hypothetical protein